MSARVRERDGAEEASRGRDRSQMIHTSRCWTSSLAEVPEAMVEWLTEVPGNRRGNFVDL